MAAKAVLRKVSRHMPAGMRSWAKKLYYGNRHWAHTDLKQIGTVQDLYYWVADQNLDTLLLVQNYFSALFPDLDTVTDGTITLYGHDGIRLGQVCFVVSSHGGARFTASDILRDLGEVAGYTHGTLEVNMAIPKEVLDHVSDLQPFYFWDRFYLGYVTPRGQTCFVHGVDRTNIYQEGASAPLRWYPPGEKYQWAPEIPVNIQDYTRFSVILVNRTEAEAEVTLTLSDIEDRTLSWSARIAPNGVHRFPLTPENTTALVPTELRMAISGMPTRYGRPVVFKEFHNGAISAMHC